jgi:two-component system, LytTR family, sensor kinase
MKSNRLRYLPHVLAWAGLYLFWVTIFQKRSFAFSTTATIEFCYLLFVAANFYLNVYLLIPVLLYKQKYLDYALCFIAGISATALLRVPVATYLNEHYFLPGKPQPAASALFVASFINIFIWTVGIVCGKIIVDRLRFQQYVEEIKKEKSKAELDFLNAQMNPHFLFNSLHSIYGHIDKTNPTARKMLLTFSDMLRYQLYDCNHDSIPIEKELDYIKNYVTLQRARKEEDLVVNMDIDKNVRGLTIAPLLFICFVENAFKYVGSSDQHSSSVELSFSRLGKNLVFKCSNTKEPIPVTNMEHKGIGISNAKRRLALHYPGKHSLNIRDTSTHYHVELTIELNEMEMHYSG